MSDASPETIRKLEAELREVLQQGDFALALDIIEELESKVPLKAAHLALKGQSLIKLRRKQDAKGVLLQAFEMDPGCGQATQLLDENFPGWTKARQPIKPPPSTAPRSQAPMPHPGGNPGFAQPSPSDYAQSSLGGYSQQPAQHQPTGSSPNLGHIAPIVVQATQGPPVYATHTADMVVNWKYVLEDLKMAPPPPPIQKTEDRALPV